ncbi:MAG: hypothetical protein V4466_11820 [Pseudomonadota bacterium]
MTRIALLAAGCAVLALAACDHPDAKRQHQARALKVVTTLDCPDRQGALNRVSTAADGQSCVYAGDGSEVTLKIVKLENGDAAASLAAIESELRALVPKVQVDHAAMEKAAGSGESVDINLPGVRIRANDAGADIKAGGAVINASDEGAEVRVSRNIEGDGSGKSERARRRNAEEGVMAMLILANDKNEGDFKMVGYNARGPKDGPLVVGVVKAKNSAEMKDGERDGGELFEDVDNLIRHNVGGRGFHGVHLGVD